MNCTDVFISSEVDSSRISPDAVIFPGCRIYGKKTSIGPGCVLGEEAPLTLKNCQLGRNVKLKGGFCSGSVFLDGAELGSAAHVRAGTILEECAGGAHAVGLKQTILFPFVQLGSLINFCDVLMAGGTDRKNHGEVGSSYIHFNFTPHQDKATASLIGDVPRGVLLNQNPVFLGGQGGFAGPLRIAYGTVIPAGGICRKDIPDENTLHIPETPMPHSAPYDQGIYKRIDRIVKNNLVYIGSIVALTAWYKNVRVLFVRDAFDEAVLDGALDALSVILKERIERLEQLAGKMDYSIRALQSAGGSAAELIAQQQKLSSEWKTMRAKIEAVETPAPAAMLLNELHATDKSDYVAAVKKLSSGARDGATAWLQSMVDSISTLWKI